MRFDSLCPREPRALTSRVVFFSLLAVLLATPHLASGQATTRGTIAGTVTDQSGGSVAGADVTATEASTGSVYKVKTGGAGDYRFTDLLVGTYSVQVSAKGFKEALSKNLVVQLGATFTLDVTLQPGSVSDVVTVSIETTNLETQTSDVGTVITTQQVLDLPLALGGVGATRSAEGFVFLVPGTTGPGTNNGAGGVFESKISGGQNFGTEVLLDGASMERSENGSSFDEAGPSVEAIGQFKVVTSTPSAAFDRSTGGWETFLTKAGTNQYHGDVYEIMQNADLNANGFFNNAFGTPRPPDTKNDYGLTFGGPVRVPKVYNGHDKTFGFFSWEQYKQNQGSTVISTVPTAADRMGNFSDQLKQEITMPGPNNTQIPVINPCNNQPIFIGEIFDPTTTQTVGGVQCRLPYANNTIPTGDISQIAQNVLALIPAPQNSNTIDNIDFSSTGTITDTLMTVRIDHNFSWADKVFFTYNSRDNAHQPLDVQYEGPAYPGGQFQNFFTHYIRVGWDHAFTPTLLNQLAIGYNRTNSLNVGSSVFLNTNWDQKLGITGLPTNNIFPVFNFGNGVDSAGYNINGDTIDNGYPVNDVLNWVHGKHTFQFGTNLNLQVFDPTTQQNESGTFNFANGETSAFLNAPGGTGYGLASFELGLVDQGNASAYAGTPKFVQKYYALFVQDDWKVTPTLTLNLGFRWSVDTPRYEVHGNYTDFSTTAIDPTTGLPGALVFAGVGAGRDGNVQEQWANTYYKDFAPRVGFAWAPEFLHQKTVLRGGYSIYYGPIVYADFGAGGLLTGFAANPAVASANGGFSPAFNINNGFPAYTAPPNLDPGQLGFLTSPFYVNSSNGRPAMVQNGSLEIQHKLPWDLLLDVAYVRTRGTYLRSQFDDFNTLDPKYFSLGSLLYQQVGSPAAIAAGYGTLPYPSFPTTGVVAQALLPFPKYGVVNGDCCLENEGQSTYDGLQASLSHRFTNGLTLLASYTFSKTLTDAADSLLPDFANFAGGGTNQDPFNHKDDKSISTQDIPHSFVLSYLYQLPVGEGKKFINKGGIVNRVIGGWEVGAVQRYQSGQPLSFGCATGVPAFNGCIRYDLVKGQPILSESVRNGTFNPITSQEAAPCTVNGDGTFSNTPAYTDPNTHIYHPASTSLYFNCAAFFDPNKALLTAPLGSVPYQFGDMARVIGNVRSQPFFNEDFSVNKRTKITERTDVLLRADFLNAFNRHVFARPVTSGPIDQSGAFGTITSTAYPSAFGNQNSFGRIIQFSLKVEF
jgi:hypothetical protein